MIRGIYSAAAGMLSAFMRQETVANNLANINTPGFKRDFVPLREAPEVADVRDLFGLAHTPYATGHARIAVGVVGTGALNDPLITDYTDGDVQVTGGELDLALIGSGFFEMRSPDGQTFYSRAGQFSRDSFGRLMDARGNLLMGDDGEIRVNQGAVSVAGDGRLFVDGEEVTTLRVLSFPVDTPMRKLGENGFVPVDPDAAPSFADANTVVQQGALEASNVDPNRAVIEQMSAFRAYEAAQRMVQLNDTILERAVNDVGRV